MCKGLDAIIYPYYSDIYRDSYTSNTDEITDDDNFTTGGSDEGSADEGSAQGGLDPNLFNYGNGTGTKSGSTVPYSLYGCAYNTKQYLLI